MPPVPRPGLPAILVGLGLALSAPNPAAAERLQLRDGWSLQSSAKVVEKGDLVSRPGFDTSNWHTTTVPQTVVGALVEDGTFPDPYFGMNLRQIPGTTYPIGQRFTLLPTPDDSPFKPAWWYRTEFEVSQQKAGRHFWLKLDGLNYRANIWLNGVRVAHDQDVVGVFRQYEYDVTSLVGHGANNAVAVEVTGPEPHDLAIMWVDWNPTPADKNMGLWSDVFVSDSGPIALRNPHVVTKLDLPALDTARITVTAEAWNATNQPVAGMLRGSIGEIRFSQPVSLGPKERKTLRFSPDTTPGLVVKNPKLWWPHRMGPQNLHLLKLDIDAAGEPSDTQQVRFGIQHYESELTPQGHRLFKVNGRPILIRGGGWASDMLLRPASRERLEAELRLTKEMGLNTVRLEGKLESDLFYDLADEMGLLVMAGWCCCDQWETWDKWDPEDHRVAPASLRSQILRIRNHPSVFVWLNGSDFPPVKEVEQAYLDVLEQAEWSRPVLSNATDAPGPVSGPSGVKMRGPYDYVPPSYWLTDTRRGGAFGFATEIGPGAAVPPIESLKRMLPADRLWPINEFWTFHAGGDEFKDLRLFTQALEARYGRATSAGDYARKAQALAYEGQRAMFEGFGRNKYTATGVIQWMLNNAWPSMIWHLYDYYLRPGGGYFGSKKACEPLHVQYSYDDHTVAVVNDTWEAYPGLKVGAQLLDFELKPRFAKQAVVDVGPDAVLRPFVVEIPKDVTRTFFLRLEAKDASGRPLSSNFYWLSAQDDRIDFADESKWWYTPTRVHSDLTDLQKLTPTTLAASASHEPGRTRVRLENTGPALAFQVRLKLNDQAGEEVLPVFWDDNYLALLPGERREIVATYASGAAGAGPSLEVEAWNVAKVVR